MIRWPPLIIMLYTWCEGFITAAHNLFCVRPLFKLVHWCVWGFPVFSRKSPQPRCVPHPACPSVPQTLTHAWLTLLPGSTVTSLPFLVMSVAVPQSPGSPVRSSTWLFLCLAFVSLCRSRNTHYFLSPKMGELCIKRNTIPTWLTQYSGIYSQSKGDRPHINLMCISNEMCLSTEPKEQKLYHCPNTYGLHCIQKPILYSSSWDGYLFARACGF